MVPWFDITTLVGPDSNHGVQPALTRCENSVSSVGFWCSRRLHVWKTKVLAVDCPCTRVDFSEAVELDVGHSLQVLAMDVLIGNSRMDCLQQRIAVLESLQLPHTRF